MTQADAVDSEELLPIVPYVAIADAGEEPRLFGRHCAGCGETLIGAPTVCLRCGARDGLDPIALGTTGRLYNYTVVHRSLPGVQVPFIFAIVDLDGGGTVKGNLVAPPEVVRFDLPVRLVFEKADRTDAKGRSYLTYHFVEA